MSAAASRDRESEVDATIEAAMKEALGKSFFAKPKQVCALLGISMSTYNRAVRAGAIQTIPRGDYQGVSRPTLHSLMKHGFGSLTGPEAA
jgi:hypothetical protein